MKLTSNSFKNNDTLPNEQVLNGFGCSGDNLSPDLKWEEAPDNTKSFAVIMHDPDAPVPNGWYHWIVVNIPNNINSFEKGVKISAPMVEAITTFKTKGYGGACPPVGHGIHHYNFTVYALDTVFEDISNLSPLEIEKIVKSRSLDSATLTAVYKR